MTYSVVNGQLNPGTVTIPASKSSSSSKSSGTGGGYVKDPSKTKIAKKKLEDATEKLQDPNTSAGGKMLAAKQQQEAIEVLKQQGAVTEIKAKQDFVVSGTKPRVAATAAPATVKAVKPSDTWQTGAERGIAYAKQAQETGTLMYEKKQLDAMRKQAELAGTAEAANAYNLAASQYNFKVEANIASGKALEAKEGLYAKAVMKEKALATAKSFQGYDVQAGVAGAYGERLGNLDTLKIAGFDTKIPSNLLPQPKYMTDITGTGAELVKVFPPVFAVNAGGSIAKQAYIGASTEMGWAPSPYYGRSVNVFTQEGTVQPMTTSPVPQFGFGKMPDITPRGEEAAKLEVAGTFGKAAGMAALYYGTPIIAQKMHDISYTKTIQD